MSRIDEKLNLTGKLFFASLAAWLVGRKVFTKVRGSKAEASAILDAMKSSRRFQDELRKPGATIDSVIEKLNVKNMSAREFERVLGIKWPL